VPLGSIRGRLTLGTALIVAAVSFAAGGVAWFRVRSVLEVGTVEFARHEAVEAGAAIQDLKTKEAVRRRFQDAGKFLLPESGVESLSVFSADGELLHALHGKDVPVEPPWREGVEAALRGEVPCETIRRPGARHDTVRTSLRVGTGESASVIVATVSAAKADRDLTRFTRSLLASLTAAVVVMAATAYALLTLALRPLRDLVALAHRIARGGTGRRLEVVSGSAELTELTGLLNLMLDRLEQSLEQHKRFAANASHELRRPLTRMMGEAELALRSNDAAAAREALGSVIEELGGLSRLVDRLLELARGTVPDVKELPSFDLGALVRDLAAEAQVLAEARSVEVQLPAPGEPVTVRGSRDLLSRAVWNLLDNAVKYVPEKGRVVVKFDASPTLATVTVEDSGPGVPPDLRLFEPFVRGTRSAEGHGLGLALARTIARRHGGDVVYEKAENCARFTLTLPVG
jgi:signal transduction histidine kinase